MDAADKTRLQKLLGMLASSFAGEAANAAAMIARMAASKKLSVNELVAQLSSSDVPPTQPSSSPPPPDNEPEFSDINAGYLAALRQLVELDPGPAFLTPWELQFATDVAVRYEHDYQLSPKQVLVADRILRKAARFYTWAQKRGT